ncbi:hypothetical protein CIB43_00779 [Mesomycoplasma hyopneumoniae]|uniref:Uncharacterized protein n=1 Tax=Mesomycoplasma hyopneumoniae TaxID=2099 RepID=A0A223MAU5_MESHO|nr:hypothetical protein CIB43_00779 [Mesomycoplasma hyopneumoniae]
MISYSITKKDETTYIANFDIVDPLAGRGIEAGGFEDRDIKIRLKKISAGTEQIIPIVKILNFKEKQIIPKLALNLKILKKTQLIS